VRASNARLAYTLVALVAQASNIAEPTMMTSPTVVGVEDANSDFSDPPACR
jgi:hypothetical protein